MRVTLPRSRPFDPNVFGFVIDDLVEFDSSGTIVLYINVYVLLLCFVLDDGIYADFELVMNV